MIEYLNIKQIINFTQLNIYGIKLWNGLNNTCKN